MTRLPRTENDETPLVGLVVALAVCTSLAMWIAFSSFQGYQNSDSLIPVLASVLHWQPFYWEQDRYGLFIPWLALPLTHPFGKFLLITGINILAGTGLFGVLGRLLGDVGKRTSTGLTALGLFLWLAPDSALFEILSPYQFFTVPFVLMGLATLKVRGAHGRAHARLAWALAAVGTLLACWVNMVAPLLACMIWAGQRPRAGKLAWGTVAGFAGCVVAGSLVVQGLVYTFDHQRIKFRLIALDQWPHAVTETAKNLWHSFDDGQGTAALPSIVLLGVGAAVVSAIQRWRHQTTPGLGPSRMRCAAALAAYALLVAAQRWAQHSGYPGRFWHPPFVLALVLACAAIMVHISQRACRVLCCVVLAAACLSLYQRFGAPSPGAPRRALEARLGQHADAILAAGATHVAGDYWAVWPAVFAANVARFERDAHASPILGLTRRSEALLPLLRRDALEEWRVVMLPAEQPCLSLRTLALPSLCVERIERGIGIGKFLLAE